MDELFLLYALCLLGGSALFIYYYPIYTIVMLAATLGVSWRWWSKYQSRISYEEQEQRRLELIKQHHELQLVYVPKFDKIVTDKIQELKIQLSKKSQTQVLLMLESIEKMLKERIMPRQESVEETLENYISTNHLVIQDELKHHREKLEQSNDPSMRSLIEQTISNLEEKQRILSESKNDLVYFYGQLKNILQQLDNMRLKSSMLVDDNQLLLDLKSDINAAFEGFNDANSLLDEIARI